MTDVEFQDIKETYLNHIKFYMAEAGNLFPHITVFAEQKNPDENSKPAVIHIPIPDEFMENDDTKDKFIKHVIPEMFKTIKEDFIPRGVAWGAEAWMRVISKEDGKEYEEGIKDWRSVPVKKEVVFVLVETKNKQESLVYDIERKGKQVNSDGDLADIIELKEAEESGTLNQTAGRFSGLFKMLEDA